MPGSDADIGRVLRWDFARVGRALTAVGGMRRRLRGQGRTTGRRSVLAAVAVLTWGLACSSATPQIDLELRPANQTVRIGVDDTVALGLYAVSDDQADQWLIALEAILSWHPEFLQLAGLDGTGAPTLMLSDFPTSDPSGLNESNPPQNGEGLYIAWAELGAPLAATPEGTLVTTFVFDLVASTPGTTIDFLDTAGNPPTDTIVFDGTVPNLDVTGTLTGASVEIEPCCPADLDGTCTVGVLDFLIFLTAWGADPGGPPDLNGNGVVDVADFLMLLAAWGPCP